MAQKTNKGMKYVRLDRDELLKLIPECDGHFSKLAKKIGCSQKSILRAYQKYPEVKEAITDCREKWLDDAESELKKYTDTGHLTALMFFLKCQGKKRGWIDRESVQVGGGLNITVRWQGEEKKNAGNPGDSNPV